MRRQNSNTVEKLDGKIMLETLYLLTMSIFVGYMFLGTTTFRISWPNYFLNLLTAILIALVVGKICLSERFSSLETMTSIVLVAVFFYAWKQNGYIELLYLLLMILGSRGISGEKIIKFYTVITTILLLVTIISAISGNIQNLIYYQGERRRRMSLGVIYPTDFSAHVFYIMLGYVYLRREKICLKDILAILGVSGIVFYYTDARMNFLCAMVLVIGLILYLIKNKYSLINSRIQSCQLAFLTNLLILSPVLCAGGIITLTICYSQKYDLLLKLNRILNGRLYFGNEGIKFYGIDFWGKYVEMLGNGGNTNQKFYYSFIDSSYVSGLLRWGGIVFVCILLIMLGINYRAKIEKDWILLWIMVLISVQCVIEHHLIEIAYNPFLWLIFSKQTNRKII